MATSRFYDFSGVRQVFANRNFAIYAVGNSISLTGLWVQRLAVGWLAWELTHSGLWLGAVAFADLFPVMVLGLFGGVLADRYDRRAILIAGQSLALVQAVLLWALTGLSLIGIWPLFGLALVQGIVVAGIQPARLSLIPELVREADLSGAVAIGAVIFNIARFVGPAIAGVLISAFGVATAFGFNALTYVALIAALLAIHIKPRPPRRGARESALSAVGSGVAYAFRHRSIAPVLLFMAAVSLLPRPALELLPGFADAVFVSGAGGLALLTSSTGLGALAAGLWLAQRKSTTGLTTVALNGGFLAGAAIGVFAATHQIWIAALSLTLAGFAVASLGVSTQTLIQAGVPDAMRGRVLSIWGLLLRGVPALGALLMGWLSDFFGLQPPVLGAVALYFAVMLWLNRRRVAIAGLEAGPSTGGTQPER